MGPKTRQSTSSKKTQKQPKKVAQKRKRPKDEKVEEKEDVDDFDSQDSQEDDKDDDNKCGRFKKYIQETQWKLLIIRHKQLPYFNINKNTNVNDVRELPLMRTSLPHSVYVNSKFSDDIDICYRRTIARNFYLNRLKAVKTAYLNARKKSKNVRKDETKGIYCKTLIDFAARREFNPDKYFGHDYDFYYTGGNLCVNHRTGQIAHVAGNNMNTLVLSVWNIDRNIPKVHKISSIDFKSDAINESEIFEVKFSTSADDLLFLRQKKCVSIRHFSKCKFELVQNFKTKDVPFISFAQDPVAAHHLVITDLLHRVRVCDLEKGVPIRSFKMMPKEEVNTSNNWNMIRPLGRNVYLYAMSKKVSIMDVRLPESKWLSNCCGSSPETYCYSFCSLALSSFENLFYVGSNHKVYCVDRRFMGKDIDSKNGAVTRWTHQMSSFPLMMATHRQEDFETIVLQSPLNLDLRICENVRFQQDGDLDVKHLNKKPRRDLPPKYIYTSPCLAYMPQGLEAVYQEARLQGKCIKQGTGMGDRVKACITGLDFTDNSCNPYLLTATSNGDLFARYMYSPEDMDLKPSVCTAAEVMTEFEENIFRSVRKTPLNMTTVCNLEGISKAFRCPILGKTTLDDETDTKFRRRHMGRWQKPIQTLSKYKDALAKDLISIWDFDVDEEEKGINISALNKTETGVSKVSGWLENTIEIQHSEMLNMTAIPMDALNTSNFNSTLADSFNEAADNSAQVDLDQSVTAFKPRVAKKKSRYVKGF